MVFQIGDDRFARQFADDLGAAEHRAAHRLVGKGALLEIVEDDVVGRVVGLADLLQDHRALAFELAGSKVECCRMSARMSSARPTSSFSTLA
jgi:hypothetical protein